MNSQMADKERKTTYISEMPYNLTYKIKNGNEKRFFSTDQQKKKKSEFANTGSVKGFGEKH